MPSENSEEKIMERNKSFGYFLAKYVHAIVPDRNPVVLTGNIHGRNVRINAYRAATSRSRFIQVPETRDQQTQYPIPFESEPFYKFHWCPPPICMVLISLLEIILFAVDAGKGKMDGMGPVGQVFIYNPLRRREAWRFLTYMFVHIGLLHLSLNLTVQIFLGIALELVHLWWRVALIYLAGVLAGSLANSLTDPNSYLAGASGGVYALVASHVATVILNWSILVKPYIQVVMFVVMMVVDVGLAIYLRYFCPIRMNIGFVAHLAGAAAGLLVGIGILRNLENREAERRLWWACVVLYSVLMGVGILVNICWTKHFPAQLV